MYMGNPCKTKEEVMTTIERTVTEQASIYKIKPVATVVVFEYLDVNYTKEEL